jgi:xanthine dehydrogenase YagR molybdenum-binding subunit
MAKLVKTRVEIEGRVSEEYTLLDEPRTTAWDVEDELEVVGQPVPRVDGHQRVSGGARYPSDIQLPGLLHAKFLRSPHAHARIVRIEISRAEQLPGVRAVLSRSNAPTTPWRNSQPLFDEIVRFAGQEVAAVVADTPGVAHAALKLIEVEYEPLPFVLDPEAALRDDAPHVFDGGNLLNGKPEEYVRGDVDKGFQQSEVIVEGSFETPAQMHNAFETHGSVATWEVDQLTVYDSTQYIHGVRDDLARWFGLNKNQVRVVKQYMGGGFGAKNATGKYTFVAALLAKRTGRPVRFFLDRVEENLATGHRSPSKQYLKIGAKKDGTLVAIDARSYSSIGAFESGWCGPVCGPMRELYACPNVRTREYYARTHTGPFDSFRAPGYVEGMFAFEVLMDELAHKLQLDPLELRIKNYSRRSPESGKEYSTNGLLDAYQTGAKAIGWNNRAKKKAESAASPLRRGIGMASQIWGGAGGPPSYAQIRIHPDASATIVTGTQDIGTGTKTILTQIAAEELSLPLEKFRIEIGDTQWGLYSMISAGSMTAASVGPAVREAAADAKEQLLSVAATFLGLTRASVTLKDGIIHGLKRGKTVERPLAEILGELGDVMIIGQGSRAPNPGQVAIRTFGAQFAEVEVDIETGAVRVLKIVASHDVGRVLNPLTLSSQIEGGVIQGLGYALMEQRLMDPNLGLVLNPDLEGYHLPTMLDIPEIEVRMIDRADPNINNLGAKGAGEPPIIPTAPAIVNAVYDAIGVAIHKLPLTRETVLEALENL